MRRHDDRMTKANRVRGIVFDRVRLVWKAIGWPLLAAAGATSLVLGVTGFVRDSDLGIPGALYSSLQLFVFEYNGPADPSWQLELARFLAPAVAGFAAVKAFLLVFGEQLLRLRLRRGHVVVCGFGDKGRALTRSLREQGHRVVGIELTTTEDAAAAARDLHVPLLAGDAREPALLLKARAHRASHLVAVCGEDGTNAEVAVAAAGLERKPGAGPLACHVHIVDAELCRLLMALALAGRRETCRLEFFNVFADGARAMLADHPPFEDTRTERRVHMLVVGFDAFGEALVDTAARSCELRVPERDLLVSVLDGGGTTEGRREIERAVPSRCTVEFLDVAPRGDTLGHAIAELDRRKPIDVVYVCLAEEKAALRAALEIRHALPAARIVARMMQSTGLATLLNSAGEDVAIAAFPLDRVCTPELLFSGPYEVIARQFHEEYRRTKATEGEMVGDNDVLVPWAELAAEFKEANRHQAAHIGTKLRAVGCTLVPLRTNGSPFTFTPEEIELLAQMEHTRWAEERRRNGWRPGPVRDTERKTTPYLVTWDELDEDIRDYDRMFIVNLPEFLARAGFTIQRIGEPAVIPATPDSTVA